MFNNLKCDIGRYTRYCKTKKDYFYILFEQGLWAIVIYRFGRWANAVRVPLIGLILRIFAFLLFKLTEIVTAVSLPASVPIGKGFYVGHYGPVILHSRARIGENCSVGPGVVLGTKGRGDQGAPRLGNNVYIGVGAKVLGGITIGNNVIIGANSVVVRDIPDGATGVGIPARVISTQQPETPSC